VKRTAQQGTHNRGHARAPELGVPRDFRQKRPLTCQPIAMSDDSFEDRLKAIADQIVRSLSDSDIDDVAQRFGVDADRARGVASNVERWLGDRLFDQAPRAGEYPSSRGAQPHAASATFGAGPHPLDLPTPEQGIALSALDSGRFTVRPGSSVLASTGADPDLSVGGAADLVNELRARDWITPDGTVTLVGRQALLRWCRAADGAAERSQPRDT
jgi:hypothetical protein